MTATFIQWIASSGELVLTCAVSALAFLAVLVPFRRGLALSLKARRVTREVGDEELARLLAAPAPAGGEPLAVATLRVLQDSLAEDAEERHPRAFIRDATKQYVLNEYDAAYAHPISLLANILPPIGFIGTTIGLAVLFVSMHLASTDLQLGALAIALSSTIVALLCFAVLEALRIVAYARMLRAIDDALGFAERVPAYSGTAAIAEG